MISFYVSCGYLIWLLLMCDSCLMATERGRNDFLWGCVAFFLTPLVAIILLRFLGDTEKMKREKIWEKESKERMEKIWKERDEQMARDWAELREWRKTHCFD